MQSAIISVHEWLLQCKGVPLELGKKERKEVELEKAKVWMLIQNNKQITSFITNTQDSYVRLHNSLDFLVKSNDIPSVSSLTKIKRRNRVRQKIEEYLE